MGSLIEGVVAVRVIPADVEVGLDAADSAMALVPMASAAGSIRGLESVRVNGFASDDGGYKRVEMMTNRRANVYRPVVHVGPNALGAFLR